MNIQDILPIKQAEFTLMQYCPLVTCGQTVKRGQRLATSSIQGMGDIHSPVAGRVSHLDSFRIRITAEGNEEVDFTDLNKFKGQQLYKKLLELGADIPPIAEVETLIINSVDAEIGVLTRKELLVTSQAPLECGLEVIQTLYKPELTVMATLKGTSNSLGNLLCVEISDQYPAGLDPLVALAVTGIESPEKTLVVDLETLFHIGRIMETGLPLFETMVTIGKEAHIVPLGLAVGDILEHFGEKLVDHDRIVLGGALRGAAAASATQGVDRKTNAITLIRTPVPIALDAACVGCGECVRHCPARLDPAMITSYAEFGLYEKAAEEFVNTCFECGLCGFFCIAHRPMLQYIRLAKKELALGTVKSGEEGAL